jgi:tetratricopeptide (TPR) repeat protein
MSGNQESWFGKNKTLVFILAGFLAGAGAMFVLTNGKQEPAVGKGAPLMPFTGTMAGRMAGTVAGSGLGAPADAGNAPGLGDLLPRLEAKVAANPGDVDGRILLAQTYNELGQRAKGLESMRKLRQELPLNDRVSFALGALLMKSDAKPDLQEALKLLEVSAASKQAAINNLARVYQGQVMVKLGDSKGAIKLWSSYLKTLPPGDERRASIEAELAKASKK